MEMSDKGKMWNSSQAHCRSIPHSRDYIVRAETNVNESESLFSLMETHNAKPRKLNTCCTDTDSVSILAPGGAHYIQFCKGWRRQPDVGLERRICTKYLHAYLKQERKFLFLERWLGATLLLLRLGLLTQGLRSIIFATIWNERNWTGSIWTFPKLNPINRKYCSQWRRSQQYSYCHQNLNSPLVICYTLMTILSCLMSLASRTT